MLHEINRVVYMTSDEPVAANKVRSIQYFQGTNKDNVFQHHGIPNLKYDLHT